MKNSAKVDILKNKSLLTNWVFFPLLILKLLILFKIFHNHRLVSIKDAANNAVKIGEGQTEAEYKTSDTCRAMRGMTLLSLSKRRENGPQVDPTWACVIHVG